MAIRRGTIPADSFTIIANDWLRDPRLSWKAKGLLAYVASHAPEHQLTTAQIHAAATDGPDAVRAALQELERAGYLHRVELRDSQGHRTGTDYELREPLGGVTQTGKSPTSSDQGQQDVSAAQSQSGKSQVGKSRTKKTTPQEDEKKTPSASPRGTRLPENWMPSGDTKEWCRTNLHPDLYSRAGIELEKFRNYWCAKTGQGATKIDWERTFKNWMINAQDRYGTRPTSGAPVQHFPTAAERNASYADQQKARARRADEIMAERSVDAATAFKLAGEEIAQNGMRAGSPIGYIDGQVIDRKQEEVTA